MRPLRLIIIYIITYTVLLSSTARCYASSKSTIKPYFAAGEKSQTDATEERDVTGSFKYQRSGLSTNFKPDDNFSLRAGFEGYHKDFPDNDQSDVDTYTYKAGVGYLILDEEEASLDTDLDFSVRNKRYEGSSELEYDRTKVKGSIKYKLKDAYSLSLSSGINNYEYINDSESDILKTFLKISPQVYLPDKIMELSGFIRVRWLDASEDNKDTTETVLSGRAVLNLDTPLLYKIKAGIETGKENTQDTEDREDSLRYEYTKWDVITYLKFNGRLKTQLEYGQKERDYLSGNNDYENWYIRNKSTYNLLKKELFNLNLFTQSEHKETDFDKVHKRRYIKNKLGGGLQFSKRANWSLKPEFSFTNYNYASGSTSDQKLYKARLTAKKYIMEDFILEGYYWYKWKDYEFKPDSEQWTVNISSTFRF